VGPTIAGVRRMTIAAALCALCAAAPALANMTSVAEVETGGSVQPSIPVGTPQKGALIFGEQLPAEGEHFFTWDFPLGISPNRPWRRWGADTALSRTLAVLAAYRAIDPGAPRVGVADVSRPFGGAFGRRFGGLGHASHQNGLDVDLLYPRRDRAEQVAQKPGLIDRRRSQDLVDRFIAAGAQYVFVGRRTKLAGPRARVQRIAYHDDHMHVRWLP
jgi:murein endopeptidase